MSTIYSPIDATQLGDVPAWGEAEVDKAFDAAQQALVSWKAMPARQRSQILTRTAEILRARAEEFAIAETRNIGTPVRSTRLMAQRAARVFDYYGSVADNVPGVVAPVPDPFRAYTIREPRGVVVAIVPWNAPLIFAAKKIAASLAYGNVCILKPAEETPITSLLLSELLTEAGVPDKVVQISTGGAETGRLLVADGRANFIVFTGSETIGAHVASSAGSNVIPVALELGGKSPQLIFDDANLERAIIGVLTGIFADCGQACIAGSRLYVQDGVFDDVLEALGAKTGELRVGDPLNDETEIGPQATLAQRDKTLSMLDRAKRDGAVVIAEARRPMDSRLAAGYYVNPTIITNVTQEMEIMQQEVFGPVLAVSRFHHEDEAISLASDTRYGLAAGLWTQNNSRMQKVASALSVGTVWINTYGVIDDHVPFGGVGRSGYGHTGGSATAELYTRQKSIWTSIADGPTPELEL